MNSWMLNNHLRYTLNCSECQNSVQRLAQTGTREMFLYDCYRIGWAPIDDKLLCPNCTDKADNPD